MSESKDHHHEFAEQYRKRKGRVSKAKTLEALKSIGISGLKAIDLKKATEGNCNATFVTPKLVIKINEDTKEKEYWANVIVAQELADKTPVVKVLAYDFFDKTEVEILVMERAKGKSLLSDIFSLSQKELSSLFIQALSTAKKMMSIRFSNFGWVNVDKPSFKTYSALLKKEFKEHTATIRKEKLVDKSAMKKIEKHFLKHVGVFDDAQSVFVHNDLHMGNILHEGENLTAIIDCDGALKAPPVAILPTLLGFIRNPEQFVEGTKDYKRFKGKNFEYLLPILKRELSEILKDPKLPWKLNVLAIAEGIMWISENWSESWNNQMVEQMLKGGLPKTEEELRECYKWLVKN